MKNRNLSLIISLCAAVAALLWYTQKPGHPIQPNLIHSSEKAKPKAQAYFSTWKDEHEAKIWSILEPYNISTDTLDNLKRSYNNDYSRHVAQAQHNMPRGPQLSEETNQILRRVFKDFNVDPQSIRIIPYVDDSVSPACANDRTMFIDEELLSHYPYNARLFVLGHELSHIINEDDSLGFIAFQLTPTLTKDPEHPLNQLHRMQELRADMTALSKAPEYAQGQQEFLQAMLEQHGEGKGITHPKLATRLALGSTMLNEYQLA